MEGENYQESLFLEDEAKRFLMINLPHLGSLGS